MQVVIYSGDDVDGALLSKRATATFGTPPLRAVRVVRTAAHNTCWVESSVRCACA